MKSEALYPYQSRVSEFVKDKPRVGIFTFFGSGKTYLSLKWLEDICEHYGYGCRHAVSPFPVLVLTMKSLIHQWGEQIEEHSDFTYVLVQGTAQQRLKLWAVKADIYVTSYDFLRSPTMLKAFDVVHTIEENAQGKIRHYFKRTKPSSLGTVIVDESTALKEARTQRFKSLRALCQKVPYRAILTGKPILEKPEEIWAQMLFLDDGETFGKSFWKFRDTYFAPGPPWQPYDWIMKPGAEMQIATKLNPLCIRVPKEEVMNELPPKRYIKVHFELSKSVRERYEQLRKKFSMELLEVGHFDTLWATTRSQKMHQLCQGIFYKEEDEYELVHTLKLDWLQENIPLMLKDGPILIWTHLVRLIPLIYTTLLPIRSQVFRGDLTAEDRQGAIKTFQRGEVDVLILSESAGYAGLNLQRANQAVFYSTGYSAGMYENAKDRCHRIGSEVHEAITYYNLVVENSMDEVVLQTINSKLNMAEEILKHIRKE